MISTPWSSLRLSKVVGILHCKGWILSPRVHARRLTQVRESPSRVQLCVEGSLLGSALGIGSPSLRTRGSSRTGCLCLLLKEHTTMNVSASANGLQINVEWTPYGGCQPVKYSIYRTERPWGSAVKIAETDSATTTYQDNSITCPFEYEYRIEAVGLCGTVFNA